ncbi:Peroxidase 5 [Bienertia sinuspersici]
MNLKTPLYSSISFLELFWALSCPSVQVEAQLNVGFYSKSCPSAEQIVKEEVMKGFMSNNSIAPGLVRMHFHDCFVRLIFFSLLSFQGCDGSVLIDSTSSNIAEKDSVVNNPSLQGFNVIDNAKTRLESQCAGVVSYADILAFVARDNIETTRRLAYDVPAGRRNGWVSLASEALQDFPTPTLNFDQHTQNFANKGLTQEEMVTLSESHKIGQSHCTSFNRRLYNFNGTNGPDPTLDPNMT